MKMETIVKFAGGFALAGSLFILVGCVGQGGKACCAVTAIDAPSPAAQKLTEVTLVFIRADSEETETEDGKGANAVDGDPETHWHTQWGNSTPECPHEVVIEMVPPVTIKGFTYLPRQDAGVNGSIKGYEFYVGQDGNDFSKPAALGEFKRSKGMQTVSFAPKAGRFIKLRAISEINGGAWTSAAEIGVVLE